jgi:hypothetical protein
MQLKVGAPVEGSEQRESPAKTSHAEEPPRTFIPDTPIEVPALEKTAPSDKHPSPTPAPELEHPRAARERHPEDPPSDQVQSASAPPAGKLVSHAIEAQTRPETPLERPAAEPATPLRTHEAPVAESTKEPAKANSVHDMKLELTGGERRVEVRLSDRGGEVKMTVRTPDAHLANTLRENLPALSARLAENGFKSEAWHPAAAPAGERSHTAERSSGSAFQDTNNPSHRDQDRQPQDNGGQRHRKNSEETLPKRQKGRDFAWLISSLR